MALASAPVTVEVDEKLARMGHPRVGAVAEAFPEERVAVGAYSRGMELMSRQQSPASG